jgi:uncharacterized protein (TIGR02186 family)
MLKYFQIAGIVALSFCTTAMVAGAGEIQLTLKPNVINIGATYNGADVAVTGQIPKSAEAVIQVSGKDDNPVLRKKEKALGLLWMNRGTVHFKNVPGLCLLYLPKALGEATKVAPDRWHRWDVGYEAIRARAEIDPPGQDEALLFGQFIRLKEHLNLYAQHSDAIAYGPADGDMKSFTTTIHLPSNLPQAIYTVDVLAVENNMVVGRLQKTLQARVTGFPSLLSSLAFDHGTLYGTLAVVIAIIAGLLSGVILGEGKGGH